MSILGMSWVKGIGLLPKKFELEFDGANFERVKGSNGHDEGGVKVYCNRKDTFNDDFNVYGEDQGDTYKVKVNIASEAAIGIWANGEIEFTYNKKTEDWKMSGSWAGSKWSFCKPDATIAKIEDGIICLLKDPSVLQSDFTTMAIKMLAASIRNNSRDIAFIADRYPYPDCIHPTDNNDAAYIGD